MKNKNTCYSELISESLRHASSDKMLNMGNSFYPQRSILQHDRHDNEAALPRQLGENSPSPKGSQDKHDNKAALPPLTPNPCLVFADKRVSHLPLANDLHPLAKIRSPRGRGEKMIQLSQFMGEGAIVSELANYTSAGEGKRKVSRSGNA